MCDRVEDIVAALRTLVGGIDAPTLHSGRALALVDAFSVLERLATTGRTLAAARVDETNAWRATGASSAEAWMAKTAGSTLSQAAATLRTARDVEKAPTVRAAMISGMLSGTQAAEITAASVADPASTSALLALASHESVSALREHCRDVIAAARNDEENDDRNRRGRYLRTWSDRDGSVRLDGRFAPGDAAPLLAAVRWRAEALRAEARRAKTVEPPEAYAADALVALADGAGAPKAEIHVRVSRTALERGRTVAGETCKIDGVGPISVAEARRLMMRGNVELVATDGVDVHRVAHVGRVILSSVRTALEARDPTCVVPGCNRRLGLEIDHIVPFSEGGPTTLDNLARLCRWHHSQKTHHGWQVGGGPGAWTWTRHGYPDGGAVSRGP